MNRTPRWFGVFWLVASLCSVSGFAQGPTVVTGGGIQPGGTVLFTTDFSHDPIGNFPRGLKYVRGPLEVVSVDGVAMLRSSGPSEFIIPLAGPLPQDFTLEFDLVARNTNCCAGEELAFEGSPQLNRSVGSAWVAWHHQYTGIIGGGQDLGISTVTFPEDLQQELIGQRAQIQVAMSGTQFRLYTNGRQIYNIPDLVFRRTNLVRVFVGGVDDGTGAVYLTRVRLAAGGGLRAVATNPPSPPAGVPAPPAAAGTPPPPPGTSSYVPPAPPGGTAPAGPRPLVPAPPTSTTPTGTGPVVPAPPTSTTPTGTGPVVPAPPTSTTPTGTGPVVPAPPTSTTPTGTGPVVPGVPAPTQTSAPTPPPPTAPVVNAVPAAPPTATATPMAPPPAPVVGAPSAAPTGSVPRAGGASTLVMLGPASLTAVAAPLWGAMLRWDEVVNASLYRVHRSGWGSTDLVISLVNAASQAPQSGFYSITNPGIPAGTAFTYWVEAGFADGTTSAPSPTASFQTPSQPPQQPRNLKVAMSGELTTPSGGKGWNVTWTWDQLPGAFLFYFVVDEPALNQVSFWQSVQSSMTPSYTRLIASAGGTIRFCVSVAAPYNAQDPPQGTCLLTQMPN